MIPANFLSFLQNFPKIEIRNPRIVIITIAVFIGILVLLPLTISGSSFKLKLEQKISQKIGAVFKINGKIRTSFLPLPKISLSNVEISNLRFDEKYLSSAYIQSIIIKPRFFSLFGSNVQIKKLTLSNPKIENIYAPILENKKILSKKEPPKIIDESLLGWLFRVDENKDFFSFENIKNIEVKNGFLTRRDIEERIALEFGEVNFWLKNKKQSFSVEGNFFSDQVPNSFELIAHTKNDRQSILKIRSSILNLSLSGEFSDANLKDLIRSNFSGKIDAQIFDLKSFVGKYVAKNGILHKKINQTSPIKISANIKNKSGKIDIENIIINSKLINGEGGIKGDFSQEKSTKPEITVSLNFSNIDIDSLWFSGALNSGENTTNIEAEIIKQFLPEDVIDDNKTYILEDKSNLKPIFENLDFDAEINIESVKYRSNDLENVNFNFITSENDLYLKSLTAEIPNGRLSADGILVYENSIFRIRGKLLVEGNNLQKSLNWIGLKADHLKPNIFTNYRLNAYFLMLPSFNSIKNLTLTFGDNFAQGNILIDDSSVISNLNIDLNIDHLNYDDHFVKNKYSTYLSSGSLLNKLIWLETSDLSQDINLKFNRITFDGKTHNNQDFTLKTDSKYLNISSSSLGNIEITTDLRPKISINIEANNLEFNQDQHLGQKFFKLPSLNNFDGEININIGNLQIGKWRARNLQISSPIEDGIAELETFKFNSNQFIASKGKVGFGEAKFDGTVILKSLKTVNGSFEFRQGDIKDILLPLMNIENISGISNVSAIVNSSGESAKEFLRNLSIQAKFLGSNIKIEGFGIYDLAFKLARIDQYLDDFRSANKILFKQDSASVFKDVSGDILIKKDANDKFQIKAKNTGISTVSSGEFEIGSQMLSGSSNIIFLTGNRKKQVPINIGVNFSGKATDLKTSSNLKQIEQYLGQVLGRNNNVPAPIKAPESSLQNSSEAPSIKQP
ncbi:MAG: hypothetical protein ACJAW3_000272 [Lentimonas sp.]|jgi:uncharacterized protein involved in outer membrane biogenesis